MRTIGPLPFILAFDLFLAGCGGRGPETDRNVPELIGTEHATHAAPAMDASQHKDPSLGIAQVELWYDVNPDLAEFEAWQTRWVGQIEEVTMIGGCDCHAAKFRIRATQRAIDDFPEYDVHRYDVDFTREKSPNNAMNPSGNGGSVLE
jgi:hypothetical protein